MLSEEIYEKISINDNDTGVDIVRFRDHDEYLAKKDILYAELKSVRFIILVYAQNNLKSKKIFLIKK